MKRSGMWAPIFGVLFVVLSVTGIVVGLGNTPDTTKADAARKVTEYFAKHGNQVRQSVGAILLVFAVFCFLWFLGGLRARLRSVEDSTSTFSNLAMAAGTAFAVLFGAAAVFGTSVGAELNFSDGYKLDPNQAIFIMDGGYALLVIAMLSAAVLLFSSWTLIRRTRVLPMWLGWIGFVFGIAMLGIWFTAWVTPLALALWVLLTSVVLLREGAPAGPPTTTG